MTGVRRTLAALLLGTASLGAPAALGAQPAAAATTTCVGVVVDYGEAKPGGGANSFCARLSAGATGADVLAARARALGRPQPTYRSDGLLCTIDGYPNDGSCAQTEPGGGYRYWSYWHRFAGTSTWAYSQSGASGFTVSDGLLEGWAYQNGGAERGRQPPAVSYSTVCRPAAASPSPRASRTASPVPSRSPARPSARPSATRTAGDPTTTSPPPASGTRAGRRQTSTAAPGSSPSQAAPVPTSAAPSVAALSPVEPPRRSPSGPPVATVAGLVLAAGIGAAALRRARSSRNPRV